VLKPQRSFEADSRGFQRNDLTHALQLREVEAWNSRRRELIEPKKPEKVLRHAEECLLALESQGLGRTLSIGGAFGLAYYLEYRSTHDVDAWWNPSAGEEERQKVIRCLREALGRFGETRTRSWGDVVSVELQESSKVVFSFQIARRSGQLEESRPAPWPPNVLLDSFKDLVAAKMVALVDRGAPRDFRDIHAICEAGLADPRSCWMLWNERRLLSGDTASPSRARLAILMHIKRIELQRPISKIADPKQRIDAEAVRAWFREEFLNGLVD